jgi:hypothetical protein
MTKHQILFLAANPTGLPERRLDQQARQIQNEIQFSSDRDRFEFVPRLAAQPMDLLRELRRIRPSVVHFSGHPGFDGIYLTDECGRPATITPDALYDTFGAAGQSVQVIVLNGCAAHHVGEALRNFVPVCVGTPTSTSDEAARAFSIGFYGALASKETVATASAQGKAAMSLQMLGQQVQPRVYNRSDIDPKTFILADHIANLRYLSQFNASNVQRYIAQHTQMLRGDPTDHEALLAIGVGYLMLGQYDLADRFTRQLIDVHPADPAGYCHRAICMFKGRRPRVATLQVVREAEQLLHTAQQLNPANGCYEALLAAIRHDYYVLNGMRVPPPTLEQLVAHAEAKRMGREEITHALRLIDIHDGPVWQRFAA